MMSLAGGKWIDDWVLSRVGGVVPGLAGNTRPLPLQEDIG